MDWTTFWLFLHVLGAIVGFGPTFAFPFIGAMAGKEPMHGNFAMRVVETITKRLLIPIAVVQAITGTILLFVVPWDFWANEWLIIGAGLFAINFAFGLFVQARGAMRLIEMTREGPPPAATGGPPPEVAALTRRLQLGGMFLTLVLLVIIGLMVFKPGAG